MATETIRTHRTSRRRRRASDCRPPVVNWLGAGAVTLGLGVAMATGQGVAHADAGSNEPASATKGPSDTPDTDKNEVSPDDPDHATTQEGTSQPVSRRPATGRSGPESRISVRSVRIAKGRDIGKDSNAEPTRLSELASRTPARRDKSAVKVDDVPSTRTALSDPVESPIRPPDSSRRASPATLGQALDPPAVKTPRPVTARSIVTDVLTWSGLAELAEKVPTKPTPVPPLVEAAWLAVRRSQYTVNNQLPTADPEFSSRNIYTGVAAGDLNVDDFEDDQLTIKITDQPDDGTVIVNPDGTFTYRPSTELANDGGTDSFTVMIDDRLGNPAHTHGLLGALGLRTTTTQTVRIAVDPIDHTPNILVNQARNDFAQAQAKVDEADGLHAQAETDAAQARQLRAAAAAILASNPDPQMKADAEELIRLAEIREQSAATYRAQEETARQAAVELANQGTARVAQARALNPEVDTTGIPLP